MPVTWNEEENTLRNRIMKSILSPLFAFATLSLAAPFNTPTPPICIDSSGTYCAQFAASTTGDSVAVLIQSSYVGWVGLGFGGTSMTAVSKFVIGWTGVASLRDSVASQEQPPVSASKTQRISLSATDITSIFPATTTPNVTVKTTLAFSVPKTYFATTGKTSLIYALSSATPSSPNSVGYHDGPHGSFSIDITNGVSGSVSNSEIPMQYIAHGACMFVAWGFTPYFIVFVARYLKFKLGVWWFKLHVAGALLGNIGCSIAAMIVITVGRGQSLRLGASNHSILGSVIVFGALPLQILLGVVADRLFDPARKSVSLWDVLHWWLGRGAIIAASANIYLGLELVNASSALFIAYWVWFALMLSFLVAGHLAFGQSIHKEDSVPGPVQSLESDGALDHNVSGTHFTIVK
ncbi:UNVERIFIED_CONTAM: hypothetical protein HDU68_005226 [Siphonaria sp. JEL0065]|nr:hypothetical protein HDU68_005226 [Siphonaria sp. JEL0065]